MRLWVHSAWAVSRGFILHHAPRGCLASVHSAWGVWRGLILLLAWVHFAWGVWRGSILHGVYGVGSICMGCLAWVFHTQICSQLDSCICQGACVCVAHDSQ
jgi:hypothetical protein